MGKNGFAAFGEFASAVVVTSSSSNNYNLSGSGANCININCSFGFHGANLGTYVKNSAGLKLSGGEIKTWKDNWSNVCGGSIFYTVYLNGFRPSSPVFSSIALPFKANCGGSTFNDGIGPCGGNDQKWSFFFSGVDLTTYNAGNYAIELYMEYYGNDVSTSGCGTTKYISNGGSNFIANFTITNPVALPIQLVRFGASCENDDVLIDWATASEFQSASFQVESSIDGSQWSVLGLVPAANNSSHYISYSLRDNQAKLNSYYRLRQNDLNGDYVYYEPVFISCATRNKFEVDFFSDLNGQSGCFVTSGFTRLKHLKLELFSVLGALVYEHNIEIKNESMLILFDKSFTPGMYFMQVVDDDNEVNAQSTVYFVK